MNNRITLIDPATYLDLAKIHGFSRNKAIELSGISHRTWAYWEYQKLRSPSLKSLKKLTNVAIRENWI